MDTQRELREIRVARLWVLLYVLLIAGIIVVMTLAGDWKTSPKIENGWLLLGTVVCIGVFVIWFATTKERRQWRFASQILSKGCSGIRNELEVAICNLERVHAEEWEPWDTWHSQCEEMRKAQPRSWALGEWIQEIEKHREHIRLRLESLENVIEGRAILLISLGLRKKDFPEHWDRHLFRID